MGVNTFISSSSTTLQGQTEGGITKNVPITTEGHLEVEIHGPRLPFNSVHTENLDPIFQAVTATAPYVSCSLNTREDQ